MSLKDRRALIVDDNDGDNELVKIRFGNFHCELIEQAYTLKDAITRFYILKPALVMLDVAIPLEIVDGPKLKLDDLLGTILDFSRSACVIMMTGHVTVDDASKATAVGASGYVDKALLRQPPAFQAKVIEIFNRHALTTVLLERTFDGSTETIGKTLDDLTNGVSNIIATQNKENARGDALVTAIARLNERGIEAREKELELKYKEGVSAGRDLEKRAQQKARRLWWGGIVGSALLAGWNGRDFFIGVWRAVTGKH